MKEISDTFHDEIYYNRCIILKEDKVFNKCRQKESFQRRVVHGIKNSFLKDYV